MTIATRFNFRMSGRELLEQMTPDNHTDLVIALETVWADICKKTWRRPLEHLTKNNTVVWYFEAERPYVVPNNDSRLLEYAHEYCLFTWDQSLSDYAREVVTRIETESTKLYI